MSNNESLKEKKTIDKVTKRPDNTENVTAENSEEVDSSAAAEPEGKGKGNDSSFKSDKIVVNKDESLDGALRRFKRQSSEIISEVRKREAYDKPSVKRKKKSKEARKKNKKKRSYF